MIASGKVTEGLAEWLCSTSYDDLPLEARGKALDVVFDSVGGMVACSVLPEVRSIVEFIKELGGEAHSTIIGQRGRVPVVNAAMANGAMAHGSEVDPGSLNIRRRPCGCWTRAVRAQRRAMGRGQREGHP